MIMKEERIAAAPKGPRNDKKITVVEYVRDAEGREVRVDELGPEQYEAFRQWLGCSWLNELFRGRAVFGSGDGGTDCHSPAGLAMTTGGGRQGAVPTSGKIARATGGGYG